MRRILVVTLALTLAGCVSPAAKRVRGDGSGAERSAMRRSPLTIAPPRASPLAMWM